jgi:hypothetical protein
MIFFFLFLFMFFDYSIVENLQVREKRRPISCQVLVVIQKQQQQWETQ